MTKQSKDLRQLLVSPKTDQIKREDYSPAACVPGEYHYQSEPVSSASTTGGLTDLALEMSNFAGELAGLSGRYVIS